MLERKIARELTRWSKSKDKKSLLVRGARQIGKTTSIRELGKEYESFIEINFLKNPSLSAIFSGDLDMATLLLNFSVYMPQARFLPGRTLLFLDEIQECPEAVTSLKFWVEDRRFDVIASGSMLGIDYKRPQSYPVGSVDYLDMHALSFEEFLWAMGISEEVVQSLRHFMESEQPVPEALNSKLLQHVRTYMVVGGMPEVVTTFLDQNSLAVCYEKQQSILQDYRYDIAHYAPADTKLKAEKCYFSLPDQLSKENHKFQYSVVEPRGTSRKFASSLDWLMDAYLICACKNVNRLSSPLRNCKEDSNFRIYLTDIGLLTAMFAYPINAAILGNGPAFSGQLKGGLYEALIADMLYKNGHKELFFRKNEQATFEIEFLLDGEDGVVPIEVKAKNSRSKSLDHALEREDIVCGYKLIEGNIGRSGKKLTLPHYMAMFL